MSFGLFLKRKQNQIINFLILAPLFLMLLFHIRYFNLDILSEPLSLWLLTLSTFITTLGIILLSHIERKNFLMLFWAFLWGGIVSTNLSFLISVNSRVIEDGIFFAAALEEFIKFLGICLVTLKIGIRKFYEFVVFGSIIGLGFYYFEYMEYLIYSYPIEIIIMKSTIFLFPHMLLTGILGATSAYFLSQQKIILSVFFLTIGILLHYLWNFYASPTAITSYLFAYSTTIIYILIYLLSPLFIKIFDSQNQ